MALTGVFDSRGPMISKIPWHDATAQSGPIRGPFRDFSSSPTHAWVPNAF